MKQEFAMRKYTSISGQEVWQLVRVMARAEGWAMVRKPCCAPSVCREKELKPVGEDA